jgi:hypothetical protein
MFVLSSPRIAKILRDLPAETNPLSPDHPAPEKPDPDGEFGESALRHFCRTGGLDDHELDSTFIHAGRVCQFRR